MASPATTAVSHCRLQLPDSLRETFERTLCRARHERWYERLWAKDARLWADDAGADDLYRNRLGWLTADDWGRARVDELNRYAAEIEARGVRHCVWLGMGGAALAARVVSQLPCATPRLPLTVFDHTHPAAVTALGDALEPQHTLFIIAGKSGTTLETDCLLRYFHGAFERAGFVAVTDRASPLDLEAQRRGFERVFHNPADVGGRYGALSHSGLLAAALCGHAPAELVEAAATVRRACGGGGADTADGANAADYELCLQAGIALGISAAGGCDKMVLELAPSLHALGPWVEQLVAESSGKNGTGLVPVLVGRDIEARQLGGWHDGCHVTVGESEPPPHSPFPVSIGWRGAAPGAEFYRWQLIIAIACAVLRVNPFDEPAVQYNKELTRTLLEEPPPHPQPGESAWRGPAPDDYFAVLSHLPPAAFPPSKRQHLQDLAARHRRPFIFCQGPGYLHSTGQLHKGGPGNGRFLLISDRTPPELPIPDRNFGFDSLHRAQALADEIALKKCGQTVLHLRLDADHGWDELEPMLRQLATGENDEQAHDSAHH